MSQSRTSSRVISKPSGFYQVLAGKKARKSKMAEKIVPTEDDRMDVVVEDVALEGSLTTSLSLKALEARLAEKEANIQSLEEEVKKSRLLTKLELLNQREKDLTSELDEWQSTTAASEGEPRRMGPKAASRPGKSEVHELGKLHERRKTDLEVRHKQKTKSKATKQPTKPATKPATKHRTSSRSHRTVTVDSPVDSEGEFDDLHAKSNIPTISTCPFHNSAYRSRTRSDQVDQGPKNTEGLHSLNNLHSDKHNQVPINGKSNRDSRTKPTPVPQTSSATREFDTLDWQFNEDMSLLQVHDGDVRNRGCSNDLRSVHARAREGKPVQVSPAPSGIHGTGTDRVVNPQRWAQTALDADYGMETGTTFTQLDFRKLVSGELSILTDKDTGPNEKEGRLRLLKLLTFLLSAHPFATVQKVYAAIFRQIELGRLDWDSDFQSVVQYVLLANVQRPQYPSNNKGQGQKPAGRAEGNRNQPLVWFCSDYQRNNCQLQDPHDGMVNGKLVSMQHICATCKRDRKQILKHPESSSACPSFQGGAAQS